jgi:hypothetical protein
MFGIRKFFWIIAIVSSLGVVGCNAMGNLNATNVETVAVTPGNPAVPVGASQPFVANMSFQSAQTLTTTAVLWSSSDPTVAKIGADGTATALKAGTTTITATSGTFSGSTQLTVSSTNVPALVAGSSTRLEINFVATNHRYAYAVNPWEDSVWNYKQSPPNSSEGDQLQGIIPLEIASRPSWLAFDSNGYYLYIAERDRFDIAAFYVDPSTGRFTAVPGSPFSLDREPEVIDVDPTGNFLEVVAFGAKEPLRYRIDPPSGTLTLDK